MKKTLLLKKITIFFAICLLNKTLKAQDEFITIWQSTQEYPSIEIPTYNDEVYNYTVNWGDGSVSNNVTGDITHEYAETKNYTVTITGAFPGIHFGKIYSRNNPYNNTGIVSIEQWGSNQWKTMDTAFYGQTNLVINTNDIPDLSICNSLSQMFRFCNNINNGSHNKWNEWNTATIISMYALFSYSNFNQAIGNWNVSNVYSMHSMFLGTPFNQTIGNWDVSNVIIMESMFSSTKYFNQDISNWNVGKVSNMYSMFSFSEFNQNINNWNVSNVRYMERMFYGSTFNNPLNNWDVSKVKKMSSMFKNATAFDQDISSWNLENIEDCSEMFNGVTLSNTNYEALLIGWNNQDLNQNIVFDGGNSKYSSDEAEAARQNMIDNDHWTITDGGKSDPLNTNTFDIARITIYKSDNSTLHINGVSNGKLNMYSITGQSILKNVEINNSKETIQIPKITSGIYLLKINSKGKEYVQKYYFN